MWHIVCPGVSGHSQFDMRFADDHVAADPSRAVDARDTDPGTMCAITLAPVASTIALPPVVAVLVGVRDLRDVPPVPGGGQHLHVVSGSMASASPVSGQAIR